MDLVQNEDTLASLCYCHSTGHSAGNYGIGQRGWRKWTKGASKLGHHLINKIMSLPFAKIQRDGQETFIL